MIGAIVHQLTRNLKDSQMKDSAFAPYFVDHTAGVTLLPLRVSVERRVHGGERRPPWPTLWEDMAAEQKARVTYDNILRLSDDPDVNDVIKFLRSGRSCIFSASARRCSCFGKSWIRRMCTL